MAAAQGFPVVAVARHGGEDETHFRELEMTLPEVAARIPATIEEPARRSEPRQPSCCTHSRRRGRCSA